MPGISNVSLVAGNKKTHLPKNWGWENLTPKNLRV